MRTGLVGAATLLLWGATSASAHRLDEYLQATTISVRKDRIQAQLRLTPGVAVLPVVLAYIDTDADGVISPAEQRAYADRVLRDLSLTVDGDQTRLRLASIRFPEISEMKEGLGEIQIEFNADLAPNRPNRSLVFENHHQSRISAYLVNCLVPPDLDIRITGQDRNYQQSLYRLDYVQAGVRSAPLSGGQGLLGIVVLLLCARLGRAYRAAPKGSGRPNCPCQANSVAKPTPGQG